MGQEKKEKIEISSPETRPKNVPRGGQKKRADTENKVSVRPTRGGRFLTRIFHASWDKKRKKEGGKYEELAINREKVQQGNLTRGLVRSAEKVKKRGLKKCVSA